MDPLRLLLQLRSNGMNQQQMLEHLGKNVPAPGEDYKAKAFYPTPGLRARPQVELSGLAESFSGSDKVIPIGLPQGGPLDTSPVQDNSLGGLIAGGQNE